MIVESVEHTHSHTHAHTHTTHAHMHTHTHAHTRNGVVSVCVFNMCTPTQRQVAVGTHMYIAGVQRRKITQGEAYTKSYSLSTSTSPFPSILT